MCIGLCEMMKKNSKRWQSALLTVALQRFQDGFPAGTPTIQAWVDMQFKMLLDDLQPVYKIDDNSHLCE